MASEENGSKLQSLAVYSVVAYLIGGFFFQPNLPRCNEEALVLGSGPKVIEEYIYARDEILPSFVSLEVPKKTVTLSRGEGKSCKYLASIVIDEVAYEEAHVDFTVRWSGLSRWFWPLRFQRTAAYVELSSYQKL